LSAGRYQDALIFNGVNQGKPFSLRIPLIAEVTIDISLADVKLSETEYVYDGTAKKPSVNVEMYGAALIEGTDYVLSYAGNTNAGSAYAVVIGKGDYSGSKDAKFAINPVPLTLTANDKVIFVGAPEPVFTYIATGFAAGETAAVIAKQPVFSLDRPFDSRQPGVFAITPSGAEAGNYTIAYVPGMLAVIEPAVVSVVSHNGDRAVPQLVSNTEASVVTPQMTNEFAAGPNPVAKSSGTVGFFRQGKRVDNATLTVYDAAGNVINKVKITDNTIVGADGNRPGRRQVGSWDLKDARGRLVDEGTYLVRGTVITADGKRERVSLVIGVR
jgi:hypothetical protein